MNPDPLHDEMAEPSSLSSPFPAPVSDAAPALPWNTPLALFNWAGSVVFTAMIPAVLLLLYAGLFAPVVLQELSRRQLTLTKPIMILQLVGTFGAQILSLLLSWIIVTGLGKRPFLKLLEMEWASTFRLPQAVGLGLVMIVISFAISAVLPQHETDMDKFLKFGLLVRVALALVATIGAPLQEEIVYRGVLYAALERSIGVRGAVVLVSLLFCAVHVPQYWQSPATLVAVLVLSFGLTLLRAWSGKLLPCVVTHLIFNGIQGVLIIVAPDKAAPPEPAVQPALFLGQLLGF